VKVRFLLRFHPCDVGSDALQNSRKDALGIRTNEGMQVYAV